MTAYILDASVAAKWFLPRGGETHAGEALQLLRDYSAGKVDLTVPDLFWPEFGNILWKAVRVGRISRRTAEEAILALEREELATEATAELLKDAFAIAARFDRAVYDAVYVALAVAADAPLLTADERLANALAARFPVRWLGTYSGAG
ncbi:MAG: type II toxin-antitoxin system VapC family toxin [Bryobacteraceae bacterium]